jgi:GTPase SAR1 family protein
MKADKMKQLILEIASRHNYELTENQTTSIELEDIAVNVAFLGEFASGKSTIVNNLIGRDLLPTYNQPTTAAIIELMPGECDEYIVERINEDGETLLESIELHQLAAEAMKYEENKKIRILQKEFGILNRDILIVDTPGVDSIDKTHTDITFGYLPFIDVAFFVIPSTKGDATGSLLNFLTGLPKSFLNKTYFILNKIDLKPESSIDRIEEKLRESLTTITPNPRIIKISALEAHDKISGGTPSTILETSMAPLISVINEEVPGLLKEIEEKRRKESLVKVGTQLTNFLELKKQGIKYSNVEITDKIKSIKSVIAMNEDKISEFKAKLEQVKFRIKAEVSTLINDTVLIVAKKIDAGEDTQEEFSSFLGKLNLILESGINEIQDVSMKKLDITVSSVLAGNIENETKIMTQTAELIRDVVSIIMTLVLIPGNSVAEKVIAPVQSAGTSKSAFIKKLITSDKSIMSSLGKFQRNFPKLTGFLGEILKITDFVGLGKTLVMKNLLKPKVREILTNNINERLNNIFAQINKDVELILEEKYRIPMNDSLRALDELRKNRDSEHSSLDSIRTEIEKDISLLQDLK